jgi:hypothetical protein
VLFRQISSRKIWANAFLNWLTRRQARGRSAMLLRCPPQTQEWFFQLRVMSITLLRQRGAYD